MTLKLLLERQFFHNSLASYLAATVVCIIGIIVLWAVKVFVLPRLKAAATHTKSGLDDFLVNTFGKTLFPLFYFAVFYLAVRSLTLNHAIEKGIQAVLSLILTITGVRFLLQLIDYALSLWIKKHPEPEKFERHVRALSPILAIVVWALGFVFFLDNLGFKISAIMAGLGIGGVAVALASQTVLADMFSYFAIMLDRPFELDDFIVVGADFMGSIEHIGIKTTRLRSLGGEQLVFSNKDLTDSRVRNFKRMDLRRVVFKLNVAYDTANEKLKKAPELIKTIITSQPDTRFDRAHFASYGDFFLIFEVVYYVLSADYNKYMDIQQEINLAIKEAFAKERILFAFPGQPLGYKPET